MKKVVVFLLALIIFVTPVTTLVKADVVIGDNDDTIINENATILGRKLALMESLSDLALSGVTEFTISNTNDVDSYLDYLWNEIDDAIDYLDSGLWTDDLNNELASKYFTNLVQYKDYINNRGDYLAHLLPSGNPTTNLLSTFFANNIFGKQSTLHNNLSLDTFRALSRINNPTNRPDIQYINYINYINSYNNDINNNFFFRNANGSTTYHDINEYWFDADSKNYSWISYYRYTNLNNPNEFVFTQNNSITYLLNNVQYTNIIVPCSPIDIYIYSDNNSDYFFNVNCVFNLRNFVLGDSNSQTRSTAGSFQLLNQNRTDFKASYFYNDLPSTNISYSGTLERCLMYIVQNFRNVNIYVNGDPWSLPFESVNNNPTLDIDGLIKIYGNDYPQSYELQPNTKIDYDQLYQVIYTAIRDNLPISQGDINYYDSHDTIYSPTIINNYGDEEGNESDIIDTILDYAVIPKFDTAIAQPMRAALTNGVVIMNNSINNVIPNEILIILGACYFLLLFAVVINRMIK